MRTRRLLIMLTMAGLLTGLPSGAFGAAEPDHLVFTDPTLDGVVLAEATPSYQDLVAGYIHESADSLFITWEVVDLPDVGIPELPRFFFEFGLLDPEDIGSYQPGVCDVADCFSVRAGFDRRGIPTGELAANCTTDETNTTSCTPVGGSQVSVTFDAAANQITAEVRRRDLKDTPFGSTIATDGRWLIEEDLFQGIAAYTGSSLLTSGGTADQADLGEGLYVLGTNR